MANEIWLMFSGLFVLGATCYLLFLTSGPLEKIGVKLGHLLRLPEDVIASTFQAFATSGPEIIMAIIAATPFIAGEVWQTLELGEKACSGTLNMAFSAMINLIGIGAFGIILMISRGTVKRDETIIVRPSVKIGLLFYIVASGAFSFFIKDGTITVPEAWTLMGIGILFTISQLVIPPVIKRRNVGNIKDGPIPDYGEDPGHGESTEHTPVASGRWMRDFFKHGFMYAFLIFALVIFVREALAATFNMALIGIFSVGGIIIMFTSYVSSFPEFMMTYRYAVSNKKDALLGMLFGSNVIDLAFAGFRALWLHEPMAVYTTGRLPHLLPIYIWSLPVIAVLAFFGLSLRKIKYKHAFPLLVFYILYVLSGLILL